MKRFVPPAIAAALLCIAILLSISPATGLTDEEPAWVQVFDQQTVAFGQLDPTEPNALATDWNTGEITLNNQRLKMDGYTGGYLQVLEFNPSEPQSEYGQWILQNIPIPDPEASAADSEIFTFAFPNTGPVGSFPLAVYYTAAPAGGGSAPGAKAPPKQPVGPNGAPVKGPPKQTPVAPKTVPTNIAPGLLTGPPPAATVAQINPIDRTKKDTKNPPFTVMGSSPPVPLVSQAQLPNQCAPGAVANSLTYLNVMDMMNNSPSTQKGSRVDALDMAMGRKNGKGTPTLNIIRGKLMYINQKGLNLVVRHQGSFCPGVNNDGCQTGTITDGRMPPGMVTSMPGNATAMPPITNMPPIPNAAFITSELDKREDMEICFRWASGNHCVQVTGYNWVTVGGTNGYLQLSIIQDPNQGPVTPPATGRVVNPMTNPLANTTVTVGAGPGGYLWMTNWPPGVPAQITHVITESPPGG